MGPPDNQVDESNAKDVHEHSSDADDDWTQVFYEEKTAHYPKIREVSGYQNEIWNLKYAMKTPTARNVSAMLSKLLPEMSALSTFLLLWLWL